MRIHRFTGCIAGSAFASGDTVVVGAWASSPFGRFVDVMWVRPDGSRVLLAPTAAVADYVASLYSFDEVVTTPVAGGWDGHCIAVRADGLRVRMVARRRDLRSWLFALRPRRLRESPAWIVVEDTLARPVVGSIIGGARGVRASGVAPGGQREFYGVADYRPVEHATLTLDGVAAGAMRDLGHLGIGLSSFPARPAVVHVTTMVQADGR